jgi:hypothetical protein
LPRPRASPWFQVRSRMWIVLNDRLLSRQRIESATDLLMPSP